MKKYFMGKGNLKKYLHPSLIISPLPKKKKNLKMEIKEELLCSVCFQRETDPVEIFIAETSVVCVT